MLYLNKWVREKKKKNCSIMGLMVWFDRVCRKGHVDCPWTIGHYAVFYCHSPIHPTNLARVKVCIRGTCLVSARLTLPLALFSVLTWWIPLIPCGLAAILIIWQLWAFYFQLVVPARIILLCLFSCLSSFIVGEIGKSE